MVAVMTSVDVRDDSLLRRGIAVNALLSLAVGGLLLGGAPVVGEALGVEIDGWLRLFGVALIGHAFLLSWSRRTAHPDRWGRLNLAIVAPYPLIMIVVAVTVIDPIGGKLLALLDGVLVAVVALVQYLGLRRNHAAAPIRRAIA